MNNQPLNSIRPAPDSLRYHKFAAHLNAAHLLDTPCTDRLSYESDTYREEHRHTAHTTRLLLIALLALTFGILVYITARAPATTDFLPATWHIALPWPPTVLAVAGSLPTFFHTLGFCLILVSLSGTGHRATAWVCTGVFIVETVFELSQHPHSGTWLADQLPHGFSHTWLANHTGTALLTGVFDPFDLIAAAAGAVLAGLLVAALKPERRHGYA
jgi:hypothetical protein